ncbi:zinc ribbon domain-containing protein [Salipaludibacillus sp. LMS25]|uniref:zinc ribbon domain-containing protein n=1 Tax=Salipaludibacillus sp. LMS25 TaxID=2924031 RepID=UPI0020D17FF4|nr:zinc ribbon domain-containing protein [Salipaludibacillus sp. LMS25]UTR14204.1 zinc ribbon domain-containing protein [Salipaludibacillus sp. LMS25]
MICKKCDYEVKDQDKFCMNCGEPLKGDDGEVANHANEAMEKDEIAATSVENNETVADESETVETSDEQSTSDKQPNEYVEKTKETAASYWNFFMASLKAPLARSLDKRSSDFVYGYFNIIVYALLYALSVYFVKRSQTFLTSNVSFFDNFIQPFLYLILSSLIMVALIFAVLKFVMRAESVSFHDVVARYGVLYTVTIVITAAYFVITLTGMIQLSLIVATLIEVGLYMAAIVTLLTLRDETKVSFDPIFAVIIVFTGYAIFKTLTIDLYGDMFLRSNPFL